MKSHAYRTSSSQSSYHPASCVVDNSRENSYKKNSCYRKKRSEEKTSSTFSKIEEATLLMKLLGALQLFYNYVRNINHRASSQHHDRRQCSHANLSDNKQATLDDKLFPIYDRKHHHTNHYHTILRPCPTSLIDQFGDLNSCKLSHHDDLSNINGDISVNHLIVNNHNPHSPNGMLSSKYISSCANTDYYCHIHILSACWTPRHSNNRMDSRINHRKYKTPPPSVLNVINILKLIILNMMSVYFLNYFILGSLSYTVNAAVFTLITTRDNQKFNNHFNHLNQIVDNPQLPISDSSFTRQDSDTNDHWNNNNNNHLSSGTSDNINGNQIAITPKMSLIRVPADSSAILKCLISSRSRFESKLNIQWSRYLYHEDITEQISPQLTSASNNIIQHNLNLQKKSLVLSDNLTTVDLEHPDRTEMTVKTTDPTIVTRFRQEIKEISDILIESSLAITPVTTRDNASYFCIASDNLYINEAKIDLLVLSLPIVRMDRIVPAKNPRSALIFWTILSDGNAPLRKTILMIKNDSLATDTKSASPTLPSLSYLSSNTSGGSLSSLVTDGELNQWHKIEVGSKDFIRNFDTESDRYNIGNGENDNYIVSADHGSNQDFRKDKTQGILKTRVQHRSYNLTFLLPGVTYTIRLAVINDVGQSNWSHITTTMPSDIPEQITEMFLIARTNESLAIGWRRPSHDNGAKINRYEMQLFDLNRTVTIDAATNTSLMSAKTNYMYFFVNLNAGTDYHFHVRACSRIGCGIYSNPKLLASTIDGEADEPSFVEVTCNNQNNQISIAWKPPSVTRGLIANYNITIDAYARYRNQTNQWTIDQWKVSFETNDNHTNRFEASILLPNTNYSVRICAINRVGICGKLSHLSANTQCSTSSSVPTSIPDGIQLSRYNKREASDKQMGNPSMIRNDMTLRNNEQQNGQLMPPEQLMALNFPQINQRNGLVNCVQVVLIKLPSDFNIERPLETYLPQTPAYVSLTSYNISDTINQAIDGTSDHPPKEVSSNITSNRNLEKSSFQAYIAEELDFDNLPINANFSSIVLGDEVFSTCNISIPDSDGIANQTTSTGPNTLTTPRSVFDGRLQPDTFYTGFLKLLVKTNNEFSKSGQDNSQQDDVKIVVKYSDYFDPIKTGFETDTLNLSDRSRSDAQWANITLSARYKSLISSLTDSINVDTLSEWILKSNPVVVAFWVALVFASLTLLLFLVIIMIGKVPKNVGERKLTKQSKGKDKESGDMYHLEQQDLQFINNGDPSNIVVRNWEENNQNGTLKGTLNTDSNSMLMKMSNHNDTSPLSGQIKQTISHELDNRQYLLSGSKTLAVRRCSNKCANGIDAKIQILQSSHNDGALTLNHNNSIMSLSKKFNRSIPLKSFCAVYECRLRNGWLKQEFEQLPKPTIATSLTRPFYNNVAQGIVSGMNAIHIAQHDTVQNNDISSHCLQHTNKNTSGSRMTNGLIAGNGFDSSLVITSDINDNTSSTATNNAEMITTAVLESVSAATVESTHNHSIGGCKRRGKQTSIALNPYLIVSTSGPLECNGGQPLSVVVCGEEAIDANLVMGYNAPYNTNSTNGVVLGNDFVRQQASLDRKAYICSKSPSDADSVWDFWRMIYEYNVPIIVMLTPIEVNGKFKCAQYWPTCDNEETTILSPRTQLAQKSKMPLAKFKIRQETLSVLQDYTVRRLSLVIMPTRPDKEDESESGTIFDVHPEIEELVIVKRDIIHFQCHNWKSFYVYSRSLRLIKFTEHVDDQYSQAIQQNPLSGPILVHCASGSGRSGVFVAVDLILTHMTSSVLQQTNMTSEKEEDDHEMIKPADESLDDRKILEQKRLFNINIFDLLSVLRFQRTTIVRSYKQYRMIYHTIAEYYLFGDTEFHTSELDKIFNHYKNLQSIPNGIENEFLKLDQLTKLETKSTYVSLLKYNLNRNRYDSIVPYDENRVILPIIPESSPIRDQTSYINASYIQNPNDQLSFIIAQNPMENTIGDFWKMIYFQAVNKVLMISSSPNNSCPQYWPDEDGFNCDYLSIRMISETVHLTFIERTFDILNIKPQLVAGPCEIDYELQSYDSNDIQLRSKRHNVAIYQYLDWPMDEPKPTTIYSLIELITRASLLEEPENCFNPSSVDNFIPPAPVVVHCDKGNRSSVVVVLTFLMRQIMREQRVDLVQTCRLVRSQRIGLINAPSQYDLIYRCLLEYVNQQGSISIQSMNEYQLESADGQQQAESQSQYQTQLLANGSCSHVTPMLPIVMA